LHPSVRCVVSWSGKSCYVMSCDIIMIFADANITWYILLITLPTIYVFMKPKHPTIWSPSMMSLATKGNAGWVSSPNCTILGVPDYSLSRAIIWKLFMWMPLYRIARSCMHGTPLSECLWVFQVFSGCCIRRLWFVELITRVMVCSLIPLDHGQGLPTQTAATKMKSLPLPRWLNSM